MATINEITKEEFSEHYKSISQDMLQEIEGTTKASIFNSLSAKLKTEFDSGGYSNEQKSIAMGQFYASAYGAMESQAVNATLHILDTDVTKELTAAKVDTEVANKDAIVAKVTRDDADSSTNRDLLVSKKNTEVANKLMVDAQASLIAREEAGFDDNLRVKEAEFNGQVAAFAVNANSTNMQEVVTRFNTSIDAITP